MFNANAGYISLTAHIWYHSDLWSLKPICWNISLFDAKILGKVDIYDQDVETSIDHLNANVNSLFQWEENRQPATFDLMVLDFNQV